jgi:hypothetical protein
VWIFGRLAKFARNPDAFGANAASDGLVDKAWNLLNEPSESYEPSIPRIAGRMRAESAVSEGPRV